MTVCPLSLCYLTINYTTKHLDYANTISMRTVRFVVTAISEIRGTWWILLCCVFNGSATAVAKISGDIASLKLQPFAFKCVMKGHGLNNV